MTDRSAPSYRPAGVKTSAPGAVPGPVSDPLDGPGSPPLDICILLATCNGARYLPEQLESYRAQSYPHWSLRVSDDGSHDGTRALLANLDTAMPGHRVGVEDGPRRGAGANFLSLLARAVEAEPDAAMAFSDQDDIWLPDKLARAARWLDAHGAARGAVLAWSSRVRLTDAAAVPFGESRPFPRPPAFGNALVQNILHGNTIVLSPAAARILARTVPAAIAAGVPYQDWWIYQVMTGVGARFHADPEPLVLYRQHGSNLLGHHGPVRGRLRRLGMIAGRRYSGWLDANLAALRADQALLTPEARLTLRRFMMARRQGGRRLATALPRLGIHRQTAQGDHMLRLMALAGRL